MIFAAPPPPARVQIVAREFRFSLSRQSIRAGRAILELRNMGEDAHDLVLERADGARVLVRWPAAQPGESIDREVRLKPGVYRFVCTVANHRALGMRARLVVKK